MFACGKSLTFRDGEVGDGLPLVHRHAPPAFNPAAAEVDDELALVVVERGEHGLEAGEGEGAGGEKERCDDDLPRWEQNRLSCLLFVGFA